MFLLETIVTAGSGEPVTSSVTKSVPDVMQYLQHINWAAPTWDLFIVLFFLIAVFLYGMSLGRDRIIVTLVSIYMALAVVQTAPFLKGLQADIAVGQFFAFRVSTFLGVFLLLFFMLSRSALLRTFANLANGSWWQVMLFSAFHVGLLVSSVLAYLPAEAVNQLAPLTRQLFAGETARFIWVSAPIAAMMIIKGDQPMPLQRY